MYIKMPDPIPKRDYEPCPVCGEAITYVFSAIAHESDGRPAHIECVVKELSERESLASGERVVYLGKGNFGVVSKQPKVEDGKKRFNVVRRIQYEAGSEMPEWRRELSPGISRDYKPEPGPVGEQAEVQEQSLAESLGTERDAIYMPRLN